MSARRRVDLFHPETSNEWGERTRAAKRRIEFLSPLKKQMVVVPGLEPGTSTLSVSRSNQLSYTTTATRHYARCWAQKKAFLPPMFQSDAK